MYHRNYKKINEQARAELSQAQGKLRLVALIRTLMTGSFSPLELIIRTIQGGLGWVGLGSGGKHLFIKLTQSS